VGESERKFIVWHNGEMLGKFDTLEEARQVIYNHPDYKKSWYGKKGRATTNNPNENAYFKIYDTEGYGWYIRD